MGEKNTIIWGSALPRSLLAFSRRRGTCLCAAVYQAIFKNPMADPFCAGDFLRRCLWRYHRYHFSHTRQLPGTEYNFFFRLWRSSFWQSSSSTISPKSESRPIPLPCCSAALLMNQLLTAVISFAMLLSAKSDEKNIFLDLRQSFPQRLGSRIQCAPLYHNRADRHLPLRQGTGYHRTG